MRSPWFILSGGLGGLLGFVLMELVARLYPPAAASGADPTAVALYFAGFGLAVGGALGATEGWVLGDPVRLRRGLVLGVVLGLVGGAVGGALGQVVYGLVPLRYASAADVDVAIALDSSGSMRELVFFGSDPRGERKKAARRLVERLTEGDRVAVIDFDEVAQVRFPLEALGSPGARQRARSAIETVDDQGGTDLSAGLEAAITSLVADPRPDRPRHVIFLTDGVGMYRPATASRAARAGVVLHTIGLGDGVDAALLASIARETGGTYHPVAEADSLVAVFETILTEHIAMTEAVGGAGAPAGELITSPVLLALARIVAWGLLGLLLGAGQGVRENSREDLRACSLGGLIGGLVGGALFDPVAGSTGIGGGAAGRAIADVVVGASIGGTMRLVQDLAVRPGQAKTALLRALPAPEERGLEEPAVRRPAAASPAGRAEVTARRGSPPASPRTRRS